MSEALVLDVAPSIHPRALRDALGHFATGVAVVTAQAGDHVVAVTINSFSSVSLSPPLVLFSIANGAASLEPLLAAEAFSISVLAKDQAELSGRFAGKQGAKWDGLQPVRRPGGCPSLGPCHAIFECRHYADYDGGDHRIIVGRVVSFETESDRAPLIFHRGAYRELHTIAD